MAEADRFAAAAFEHFVGFAAMHGDIVFRVFVPKFLLLAKDFVPALTTTLVAMCLAGVHVAFLLFYKQYFGHFSSEGG